METTESKTFLIDEAVFQARGLLTSLDPGRNWDDASACIMAQPRNNAIPSTLTEALIVYPNPVHSELFVRLEGAGHGTWTLQLLNPVGQKVATWERASGKHLIELPDLPAGIYTLFAEHPEGIRRNVRVAIAR
jgi:hypothetical protein